MLRAVWLVVLAASCFAGKSPFEKLTTAEALQRAANENKYMLAYCYAPSCEVCQKMDSKTFKDKKVMAWIKEKAVAVAVPVDQNREFVKTHKAGYHPTLLFFKPDGSLAWNEQGYCDAVEFMQIVAWVNEGKSSLQVAREAVAADAKSGEKRIKLALRHCEVGDRTQAVEVLDQLLADRHAGLCGDVTRSVVYTFLASLGFEATSSVLDKEFERHRQTLLAGKLDNDGFSDLCTVAMRTKKPLLPLYDEAVKLGISPTALEGLDPLLTQEMLYAKRYEDAIQLASLEQRTKHVRNLDQFLAFGAAGALRDRVIEKKRQAELALFHLLLGLNRLEEANQLAAQIVSKSPTCEDYQGLARIAILTRLVDEQMLGWAKQAYDLSEGKRVDVIITYGSALTVSGRLEEGQAIYEKGLALAPEGSKDRVLLTGLIQKVKGGT